MKVIFFHFECGLTSFACLVSVFLPLFVGVIVSVIDNAGPLKTDCSVRPTCCGQRFQVLVPRGAAEPW